MPLRYPGTYVACGLALAKGAEALYDRQARTVRCVGCPTGPQSHGEADTEEPQIEAGTAGACGSGAVYASAVAFGLSSSWNRARYGP